MNQPYFLFEITSRCNSTCLYCYNTRKEHNCSGEELSFPEIKNLFNRILEEITPKGITLIGGEPLLHPNLLDVISFINSKNIRISISSNGTLLHEEMVKKIIDSGSMHFEISLDSLNEKNYYTLTSNNQLHNVKNAILYIKKHSAQLTVNIVVNKFNIIEIEDIVDFCFALSVDHICLSQCIPQGSGKINYSQLHVSQNEFNRILTAANTKSKEYDIPIQVALPIEPCRVNLNDYPYIKFGVCRGAEEKWAIDPLGNLKICELDHEVTGNLFEKNFYELSTSEKVISFKKNTLNTSCNNCTQFEPCRGGCRFLRC